MFCQLTLQHYLAVVVAQLAEWLYPTPEIPVSNPDIHKNFMNIVNYIELSFRPKRIFKKAGKDQFFKALQY